MKTKNILAIVALLFAVVVFAQAKPEGKKHIGFILDLDNAKVWRAQLTQIAEELNKEVEKVVETFDKRKIKQAELCSMSYEIIMYGEKFKKKPDMVYEFRYSNSEEFWVNYRNKKTVFIFPRKREEKLLSELQEIYIPLFLNLDEFQK